MTPNKRDLKSYARFDGTGRIVPGSLVLRRSKPKVGNWKEIPAYECCNPDQQTITVTVTDAFPFTQPDFVLSNAMGDPTPMYMYNQGDSGLVVNSLLELNNYLNHKYGQYGHFYIIGTDIKLNLNAEVANIFYTAGSTLINAQTFAD